MAKYSAPLDEIRFLLYDVFKVAELVSELSNEVLETEITGSILSECAKLCENTLSPLNQASDLTPPVLENGFVRCTPGFKNAYKKLSEGGWIGMGGSPKYGGMGLPRIVISCLNEMMGSACLSLALNPLMTQGQIDALSCHANDEIKQNFLPNLISGKWSGTMNLTEPSAGSDVGALKTKAVPLGNGEYLISGQKIYISWGDHDLTENICHLVLARCVDSPEGSKGISLFIVPKFISKEEKIVSNHVETISLEKKMGLHGSPTAIIQYTESKGWIVGQENNGMAAMFTMMNNARLGVAVQGLSQCEISAQHAIKYAKERVQGRSSKPGGSGKIVDHPDVRRNLLIMKSLTSAVRAMCYDTAISIDLSSTEYGDYYKSKAAFMIPIAKAFSTDIACEVTQLGVQVHGGMGYITDTGVEQFYRDARVTSIYEGTNGIQAIDLVGRKMIDNGITAKNIIGEVDKTIEQALVKEENLKELGEILNMAKLNLVEGLDWMLSKKDMNDRFSGASPFLKAFGYVLGGHYLLKAAMVSNNENRAGLAKFYMRQILPNSQSSVLAACCDAEMLYNISIES